MRGRRLVGLALVVLLAALVRWPFWAVALRTAPDGDTAIVGSMARHFSLEPTFWGQPYGSPLDGWLAAPFVRLLGPTILALRLPYFLLSLALVPLAYALARRIEPGAALPAAFVLACPPAYLLVLSALPPPSYPTTLVLLGGLALGAMSLSERLQLQDPARGRLAAWGAAAGLALWTHLVSAAVIAPALGLLWRAARRRRRALAWALVPFAVASAPWWSRLGSDPAATSVISVGGDRGSAWRHFGALLPRMHEPILGLIGGHVPYTADDPEQRVSLPAPATAVLALAYFIALAAALRGLWRARRRAPDSEGTPRLTEDEAALAMLLASALLVVAAFPLPLRSGPETIRFLTPAYLPLAVLVTTVPAARGRTSAAWVAALSVCALHLVPAAGLARVWREASQHALVPDCRPVLKLLDERGVRRAWASYNPAWCLTYLSGERVVASQPWNERFFGQPLRQLDEVRFARDVAWVLMPGADFDLPSPERFEARLLASGGRYRRTELEGALVYDRFEPPFPARAVPLAAAGPAGDGDPATRVVEPGRGPTTFRLATVAPLGAITFVGSAQPPGLPAGMLVEVSPDGARWERLAHLRPGRASADLFWLNGQPQARAGVEFLSLPLGGRPISAVRLTPTPAQGDWALAELLLHGPAEPAAWDEWLDGGLAWTARRQALAHTPRPDRADWYFRTLVAARREEP